MASENIEERPRQLETSRNAHDLICKTVSLHTQQISDLGNEYNLLEEALHNLEQANNDREERVRKLEREMRAISSKETIESMTLMRSTEQPVTATSKPTIASLAHGLETQQSMLNGIAQRLHQLEHRQPSSLFSFHTHEIAETLLLRLGNGDKLEHHVHIQLQTRLCGQDHTQLTPALTESTSRGESALSTASHEQQNARIDRDGPPKRTSDTSPEEEPPLKRQRGRPSTRTSSESTSASNIAARVKRPRGRPRLYGQNPRNSSYASTSSSLASLGASSKTPARTPVPSTSLVKKKGTATKRTPKKPKPRWDMVEVPSSETEKSGGGLSRVSSAQKSNTTTPKRAAQLKDVAKSPIGHNGSDELIAVTTRTRSIVTPNAKSASCGISSEGLGEPKSSSSLGYRDIHTPDLAVMEQITANGLAIPPERRSGRKPKPSQHYGNPVPWKEANLLVNTLRPSAP